jgi:hypothetical protein
MIRGIFHASSFAGHREALSKRVIAAARRGAQYILAGTYREQRIVLNTMRYISNELQISPGMLWRQRSP